MTDEQNLAPPPIDIHPEGDDVDQSTRDFITAELNQLRDLLAQEHNDTRTYVDNAIGTLESKRAAARTQEQAALSERITSIDNFVIETATKREAQLAERPTITQVRSMIDASMQTAALTFGQLLTEQFAPMNLRFAKIEGAVETALSGRNTDIQRLERGQQLLRDDFEEQILRKRARIDDLQVKQTSVFGAIEELSHTIYGRPNAPDGPPSLMSLMQQISRRLDESVTGHREETLAVRQDYQRDQALLLTRLERVEKLLEAQERERLQRIERYRTIGRHTVAFVKDAPRWFQFGIVAAGIIGGGTSLTAALLALADLFRSGLGI